MRQHKKRKVIAVKKSKRPVLFVRFVFFFRCALFVYAGQRGQSFGHADISLLNGFVKINDNQTGILHEPLNMGRGVGVVFGDAVKMQNIMPGGGNA